MKAGKLIVLLVIIALLAVFVVGCSGSKEKKAEATPQKDAAKNTENEDKSGAGEKKNTGPASILKSAQKSADKLQDKSQKYLEEAEGLVGE